MACELCKDYLHIKDCPSCGRSCKCHSHMEPLTAAWEQKILKTFIERHGAENVRDAVSKLEAQLEA